MGIVEAATTWMISRAGGGAGHADLVTGAARARPPRRVVALIAGPNPSFDYFLAPRAAVDRELPWDVVDMRRTRPGAVDLADAFVLICRYCGPVWRNALVSARDRIAGVGLFLDDDFPAFVADESVPAAYRLRVAAVGLAAWRPLSPLLSRVWFSSRALADLHPAARSSVLAPAPSPIDLASPAASDGVLRIGFHAKSSHREEHRFAAAVARRVLESVPEARFDVVAGGAAEAFWAGLPRVDRVGTLSWPAYRGLAARKRLDLLLSPLVPSAMNAGRSPTKAIDAVRFGAAGLFSDHPVYRPLAATGALLPLDVDIWAAAVTRILRDSDERRAREKALREEVSTWAEAVRPLDIPGRESASDTVAPPAS